MVLIDHNLGINITRACCFTKASHFSLSPRPEMSESKGDYVHLPEPPKNQPKFKSSSLTFANTIAFLTTVHGRDKFYRLLQFAFKQVALVVAQSHPAGEANSVSDSCSKIAGGLVAGRRFLRIGSLPGRYFSM